MFKSPLHSDIALVSWTAEEEVSDRLSGWRDSSTVYACLAFVGISTI